MILEREVRQASRIPLTLACVRPGRRLSVSNISSILFTQARGVRHVGGGRQEKLRGHKALDARTRAAKLKSWIAPSSISSVVRSPSGTDE